MKKKTLKSITLNLLNASDHEVDVEFNKTAGNPSHHYLLARNLRLFHACSGAGVVTTEL